MTFRTVCLLILLPVLLTACRTPHHTRPPRTFDTNERKAAAKGLVPVALNYGRERRFNEIFLESLRQKYMDHIDAQYELLNEALKLNPDATEAIYEMGVLKLSYTAYSDTVSRAEGDSLLHRAVELEPNNLFYKETLATHYANRALYREAIKLYEEIADANLSEETLATLIWLYKTSGDYAGAIRTIERLERIDGRSEQLSMEKFQTYIAMNDNEHAYQAIEDLCAEYPLDLRYRVLMGDLYDQHGYHEQALTIYRDVLDAEPDNSYAQISLLAYYKAAGADSLYMDFLHKVVQNPRTQSGARLEALRTFAVDNLTQKGDAAPVVELFHKAFAQYPDEADIAELYAAYTVERKMPADSVLSAMNRVLQIEPDNTKIRLQVLQIMLQRDNMDEVARICREGELYEPSEVAFYYYEGTAHYRMGRGKEAIRALQKGAERLDENNDAELASDILASLGDVLYDCDRQEEAFNAYDRALEYNANNLICLNNYAYFLSLTGKELEKAARMSRITVENEGDNPTYLDTYAWILFRRGLYEQARIYIREALRYVDETPENATIYDHAGDILYKCGDRAKALEYWKKALALTADKTLQRKVQRKIWRRRI